GLPRGRSPSRGWVSAVGIARIFFPRDAFPLLLCWEVTSRAFSLDSGVRGSARYSLSQDDIHRPEGAMVAANERFGRIPRAVVMLPVLLGAMGAAQAADRFVSTVGSDTANDCLTSTSPCRTVGYALTQAASGDTVKVAGGTYGEN